MNKLTIIGNLTADPELRTTQNGKSVCGFTVAVNRRNKVEGQPDADFFRISAWNQLGESCSKYLAKGKKVCVIGSVSVKTYQTQNGETRASMEVMAQDVEFLTPRGDSNIDPQSGY
jgi:single-strand DNA-binding protein